VIFFKGFEVFFEFDFVEASEFWIDIFGLTEFPLILLLGRLIFDFPRIPISFFPFVVTEEASVDF